jgi:hypothetical protein
MMSHIQYTAIYPSVTNICKNSLVMQRAILGTESIFQTLNITDRVNRVGAGGGGEGSYTVTPEQQLGHMSQQYN